MAIWQGDLEDWNQRVAGQISTGSPMVCPHTKWLIGLTLTYKHISEDEDDQTDGSPTNGLQVEALLRREGKYAHRKSKHEWKGIAR